MFPSVPDKVEIKLPSRGIKPYYQVIYNKIPFAIGYSTSHSLLLQSTTLLYRDLLAMGEWSYLGFSMLQIGRSLFSALSGCVLFILGFFCVATLLLYCVLKEGKQREPGRPMLKFSGMSSANKNSYSCQNPGIIFLNQKLTNSC